MATSDYKGQFIKFFDTLSPEEQDELLILMESKRSDVEKYKEVGNYTICPECGSTQTKKYGKTAKGTQRRLCKDCGKTWVEAEVNLSRLSETQKTALFMGMIQNLTISQLAERMNVCESTAYRYKMQVMDIIYLNTTAKLQEVDDHGKAKFRLEGDVQCDEYYTPVSFKGKRDPEFFIFGQRRFTRTHMTVAERVEYLHKHGLYDRVMAIPGYFEELQENAKSYRRGISNDQLCTVVAVDDDRNILAMPTNIGRMDKEDLGDLLTKHLDRRSTLITDSHSSYPPIAEAANARHVQIESGQHTSGRYHLGAVNSIHSEIEKFMPETAERLPSTKYTAQYMAFFSWLWEHKKLSLDEKVILLRRTYQNGLKTYSDTYDSLKNRPLDINTKGEFPQVI